jgi:hypothetical protein
MSNVVTYQNVVIDEEHIRIKKACVYSTQVQWSVMYSLANTTYKEQCLLLQSPWMVIPYPVIFKDESKTFQLTCCHEEFCNKMIDLETHILDRVRTAHVDIHNKKVLSSVRVFQATNDKIFKIGGNAFDTAFFDQNGNKLHDAQCLSQHKRICVILLIKTAWCSSTYYGLDVVPLQIKVELLPQLSEPSFVAEEDDLDREKYSKMIRMKIPVNAVRNRMKLDGHADAVIDAFLSSSVSRTISPTLPVTLPPSPPTENQKTPMLGFLSQIKSRDFKLKKRTDDDIGEVEKKVLTEQKLSKIAIDKHRQIAPSLDDILLAKERLRAPQKDS